VEPFPAIFISHGAPLLAIQDSPARRFLSGLGRELGKPDAILAATAHWCTPEPVLGTAAAPPTVHDFGGFPDELYALS
jgi:4,5-DOPA dioxygenase extradiol